MTPDSDEGVDPAGSVEPGDDSQSLTPRQDETAQELRQLHPNLANLYVRGVGLLPDLEEPGVPLLVGHIGRELALGVRDLLLEDEEFELPEAEARSVPDDESHRESIARTLQLPPNDPRVTRWLEVYDDLTRWAHSRISSPDPDEVRRAYEDLETILHGRVGPYFATQDELDRFLDTDRPSPEDVERLQPYLLRPAQRRYFFRELENPSWVPLLVEAGAFSDPPEWIGDEEKGGRPRPWPEGSYLARVAEEVPEFVVDVIQGVSGELRNPAVWNVLATAGVRIPPEMAGEVVPKFREALRLPTARLIAGELAGLVQHLASDGEEAAFSLAGDLLRVPSSGDLQVDEGDTTLPSDGRWLLPRIDWPAGETLFDRAVPALEEADALRTLELLLSRVNQVTAVIQALDMDTLFWRPDWFDIESEAERPDSPERLFAEAVCVLRATAPRDESSARRSLDLVDRMSENIGHRLRYVLLAEAGHLLPEEVDEALVAEAATRPRGRARELALFLRKQFEYASPSARRLFRYSLEQGPTLRELKDWLAFRDVDEPDEEDLRDARRAWQRKRILWFRDQVPEELAQIAESVGITPGEAPSARDRELAEVGFYSAGVRRVRPESPLEHEQLEVMDPDEVVRALVERQAESESSGELDIHGLGSALGRLGTSDSEKLIEAANLAVESGLEARLLRAFILGFHQVVEEGTALDWSGALRFASMAVATATGAEDREARRLVSAVAELLNSGFSDDSIPPEDSGAAWQVLAAVGRVEALSEAVDPQVPDGFHGLLTMALNHPAGRLAWAVCSGVLWIFRAFAPEGARLNDAAPDAREAIAEKVLPVLEEALQNTGKARLAVEAIVGQHLPQLHYVAPDWLAERADTLLRPGCENPLEHPAWSSYLWNWGYVGPLFETYRGCYLLAAQSAERLGDFEGDGSGRSVADHLASHLLVAVLRGAAAVGDEDELLETAFANLPPSARSHAYWGVFRAWSDAEEAPPPEFVDRLLGFWRWRLEQLAEGEGAGVHEEARGLAWLIRAPHLPEAAVAELGARSVTLAEGDVRLNTLWERLAELVTVDPSAVADIVLRAVDAALTSEHPLVSAEEGMPVVGQLLDAVGEERRSELRRMVDRLGEAGFEEFGELLENGP